MNANAIRRPRSRNGVNDVLLDDGKGKKEPRVTLPLRVAESLLDYVRERAGWKKVNGKWQRGAGEMTAVLEDDLRLARHLHRTLQPHKLRLQRVALDEGLDWSTQAHELYGRLILSALDDAEKRRK
jgi:hypothetical protein